MEREQLERLAELAASQHGQSNVWQARELGVSDVALSRAVDKGLLARVRPRVYRFAGVPGTWRTEVHADTLSAPRGAWAAQSTALDLHGVRQEILPVRRELLTLGTGLVHVDDEVLVHRTRRLIEADVESVAGIPSTSLARTLIDVTPGLEWWQSLDLLDRALAGRPSLRRSVHHAARRLHLGRPGVDRLMKVTGSGAEEEFWSWLERTASPLVARAGVTDSKWNVQIPGLPEAGIVDTYSEEVGLVIEWKGLAFHRLPNQLQRDSDKQNAAASRGLTTLSFTWLDVVTRGDYVTTTVHAASRRRRAA